MAKTYSCNLKTPIGSLQIIERLDAIVAVSFSDSTETTRLESQLLQRACTELLQYFSGNRTEFSVPLSLDGSDFQKAVWLAISAIPYGTVQSYGEVARRLGNPKACRAVGMANHVNPVPIIIPCHRVVGSDGRLTGYAGGLGIKRYLLTLEQTFCSPEKTVEEPHLH